MSTDMQKMEPYIKKQLSEGYNAELNKLLDEWISSYETDERYLFCQDGLVVKYKDESSGYDINKEWDNAERKIMFIVKECPDSSGYDTRRVLVDSEEARELTDRRGHYKNIARMLYGLQYMTEENKGKELSEQADNDASIKQAFHDIPFAYVEAKKLARGEKAGSKSCSSKVLCKALNRDWKFLNQEIDILRPNIIVCCDSNGDIFNSVVKNYFKNRIPAEDAKWDYNYPCPGYNFSCKLYYYKEEGVLLFQSYHPTSQGKEGWTIRERVFSPFKEFFETYKTFDVVSSTAQKQ